MEHAVCATRQLVQSSPDPAALDGGTAIERSIDTSCTLFREQQRCATHPVRSNEFSDTTCFSTCCCHEDGCPSPQTTQKDHQPAHLAYSATSGVLSQRHTLPQRLYATQISLPSSLIFGISLELNGCAVTPHRIGKHTLGHFWPCSFAWDSSLARSRPYVVLLHC